MHCVHCVVLRHCDGPLLLPEAQPVGLDEGVPSSEQTDDTTHLTPCMTMTRPDMTWPSGTSAGETDPRSSFGTAPTV